MLFIYFFYKIKIAPICSWTRHSLQLIQTENWHSKWNCERWRRVFGQFHSQFVLKLRQAEFFNFQKKKNVLTCTFVLSYHMRNLSVMSSLIQKCFILVLINSISKLFLLSNKGFGFESCKYQKSINVLIR